MPSCSSLFLSCPVFVLRFSPDYNLAFTWPCFYDDSGCPAWVGCPRWPQANFFSNTTPFRTLLLRWSWPRARYESMQTPPTECSFFLKVSGRVSAHTPMPSLPLLSSTGSSGTASLLAPLCPYSCAHADSRAWWVTPEHLFPPFTKCLPPKDFFLIESEPVFLQLTWHFLGILLNSVDVVL